MGGGGGGERERYLFVVLLYRLPSSIVDFFSF